VWEVIVLEAFFPDTAGKCMAKIKREFHIVQDLDCGILFGNDIIVLERITINPAVRTTTIKACNNFSV